MATKSRSLAFGFVCVVSILMLLVPLAMSGPGNGKGKGGGGTATPTTTTYEAPFASTGARLSTDCYTFSNRCTGVQTGHQRAMATGNVSVEATATNAAIRYAYADFRFTHPVTGPVSRADVSVVLHVHDATGAVRPNTFAYAAVWLEIAAKYGSGENESYHAIVRAFGHDDWIDLMSNETMVANLPIVPADPIQDAIDITVSVATKVDAYPQVGFVPYVCPSPVPSHLCLYSYPSPVGYSFARAAANATLESVTVTTR